MNVFKELKLTKDKVAMILEKYTRTRDNDNLLVSLFIYNELGHERCESMSGFDLLRVMANKGVTQPSSILRARRSLQAERVDLRGANYNKRQESASEVREKITSEY